MNRVCTLSRGPHFDAKFQGNLRATTVLLIKSSLARFIANQVTAAEVQEWCRSRGVLSHCETSAKDAINVDAAFVGIARHALKQVRCRLAPSKNSYISVDKADSGCKAEKW